LIIGLILIASFKGCSESTQVTDTEYHNGYITEVWYYEDWSEWIEETCSREYACGQDCTTDSQGKTTCTTRYCTEYYDCSYEKYHDEYWMVKNNLGETWMISSTEYERLVKKFNNRSFVEMHRDYYDGDDGDAYVTYFQSEPDKLEHTATIHSYENRVQASNSVFKYENISDQMADSLKLFDYPSIKYNNYSQKHLLGIHNPKLEQKLDYLNGMLGKKKQVKVFFLVFKNKPENYAQLQDAYWKGGNKNEFNIVISVDKNGTLQWSHVMTWSESQELKIEVRNYLQTKRGKKVNYLEFIDYLYDEVDHKFVRKQFKDFSYLEVEMTDFQMKALWWTVFIVTLLISFYMVVNEFESNDYENEENNNDNFSESYIHYTSTFYNYIGKKITQLISWFTLRKTQFTNWLSKTFTSFKYKK
jgi:hypothetical protein